jgi:hypothetical protein
LSRPKILDTPREPHAALGDRRYRNITAEIPSLLVLSLKEARHAGGRGQDAAALEEMGS